MKRNEERRKSGMETNEEGPGGVEVSKGVQEQKGKNWRGRKFRLEEKFKRSKRRSRS